MPILCDEVATQLTGRGASGSTASPTDEDKVKDSWRKGQSSPLLQVLAEELAVAPCEIVDFDLSLFDTQNACKTGANSEYIAGARIDNLASCYVALASFLDSYDSDDNNTSTGTNMTRTTNGGVNMIALFDHEVHIIQ
jgi:aspartyl aminopeptidase